ncbi:MAG: Chromate resistance protein ChrB, partial [Pseudomonadota bacterium]
LPTEPSRHRVATWRGLKKMGAVNIQQSMWILPEDEGNYSALKRLSEDIEANSGEAFLMKSEFFDEAHEKKVISQFNTLRADEYTEFIDECNKYLKEIEKEISREKFTFPELEEEEAELEKLISWHEKIKKRDIFSAPKGAEAHAMLVRIREAFDGFSEMVYRKEVR